MGWQEASDLLTLQLANTLSSPPTLILTAAMVDGVAGG